MTGTIQILIAPSRQVAEGHNDSLKLTMARASHIYCVGRSEESALAQTLQHTCFACAGHSSRCGEWRNDARPRRANDNSPSRALAVSCLALVMGLVKSAGHAACESVRSPIQ